MVWVSYLRVVKGSVKLRLLNRPTGFVIWRLQQFHERVFRSLQQFFEPVDGCCLNGLRVEPGGLRTPAAFVDDSLVDGWLIEGSLVDGWLGRLTRPRV